MNSTRDVKFQIAPHKVVLPDAISYLPPVVYSVEIVSSEASELLGTNTGSTRGGYVRSPVQWQSDVIRL